jgi:hypothetical protein
MWDALAEICRREQLNVHELCSRLERNRKISTLTAAMRVYIMNYFRRAAHRLAGEELAGDEFLAERMIGSRLGSDAVGYLAAGDLTHDFKAVQPTDEQRKQA